MPLNVSVLISVGWSVVISVVLYGCETESYIKGGMQAKGIENRILRQILGPKRNENGEWRSLQNEELSILHR